MKYAVFSDIHANLEALEKALSYLQTTKPDAYVVLGDTLGYGANPNECLDWAIQNAAILITGNHEKAVTDLMLRDWFNPAAREAIEWTEKVLDPNLARKLPEFSYLKVEKGIIFTHASPDQPEDFRYLLQYADAVSSFKQMSNDLCFVGHTHVPCCFCEQERTARHLLPGILKLEKNKRYILNPGSVGQPRDRDPRLSFGIYDDIERTFEVVRLEYDNEKAAQKIRQAGLPKYLADRLL
jgi:predicted phosphodiesterase